MNDADRLVALFEPGRERFHAVRKPPFVQDGERHRAHRTGGGAGLDVVELSGFEDCHHDASAQPQDRRTAGPQGRARKRR